MPDLPLASTPWALQPTTLIVAAALAIVAALLGEWAWRRLRWPRLVGPLLVGSGLALAGLHGRADDPALRVVVDLALAVLLFEAGSRVDLRWLGRNRALAATALLESTLAALAVWAVARWAGVQADAAVVLGLVAASTSPVVLQRVVADAGAAGQASERLVALATLGTLAALLLLEGHGAGLRLADPSAWPRELPGVVFRLSAALVLGALLGEAAGALARRIDLRNDTAALPLLAGLLVAVGAAGLLGLSTLLVPLVAGLWLRNRSERPWVQRRQFGSAGAALALVTFVAVASAPSPAVLVAAGPLALALVGARAAAKALAVMALARPSGLSWPQALAVSAGLLPMSATSWMMAFDHAARHPELLPVLMPVLLAMLAIVELPGPLVARWALQAAGEVEPRGGPLSLQAAAEARPDQVRAAGGTPPVEAAR